MRKACIAESNVDEKYIIASVDGNLPDIPELKCYVLCLLEHSGIINANGDIDFAPVLHLLPPENQETIEKVTNICKTKRKHFIAMSFIA